MALAWAAAQSSAGGACGGSALSALLATEDAGAGGSGGGGGGGASSSTAPAAAPRKAAPEALPPGYILVMTQVLPDGLGDLIFGESAVQELQRLGPVVWLRCYTSQDNFAAGERLVAQLAATLPFSAACHNKDGLTGSIGLRRFNTVWVGARECFLAPWIFGLSAHEETVVQAAEQSQKNFWALTEYGRGMGNIHTYTKGFGAKIPTGWASQGEPGGVFRSILNAPRSGTDWRRRIARSCGLSEGDEVRLWWFYSRKDDEKKHDFAAVGEDEGSAVSSSSVPKVAKVIPVGPDGKPITDPAEKTNGEKLAEQLFEACSNPDFQPTVNVSCAEATAGCAGQLSQFVWGVLFEESFTRGDARGRAGSEVVDIIVAPNLLTRRREANGDCAVAEVVRLDLLRGSTCKAQALPAGRRLFVCSTKVPRDEMRSFLEQSQQLVFTTGDQSLAEAMFMDKIPCIKPDAKVQQWQLALIAKATGALDTVPNLGQILRQLVEDPVAREEARQRSKTLSDALERKMCSDLGGPPASWAPQHHVLARAGMMG